LEITPAGTSIRAGDAAGLFYGAVTLWQLLTGGAGLALPATLPALRITDSPRFRWRGFMLDSARHMQSVEHIKRLIDQAARHKLNTFHWHLVDDQGWRLEIKRYPKLTEVGAWRIPAGKAGIGPDGQPLRYGGFYTQAEARDIVAYAAERHITIVPEIEMPGHARAALAAYPEFGPTGQPTEVTPNWGIHPFIFDVTDEAFAFLENILREVFEIFPGSYIHIGGDEAIKPQWKKSARVQEKIRALGLADENALQSWFIRRIAQFITAQNRKLIGWDEILDGGPLPEGANVMVWHDIKNAAVATRSGHDVVMTPTAYTYLNRAQSLASDETPGHDWVTSLQKVYEFEPIPDDVPQAAAQRIIGYQANLWTEYIRTPRQVDHMLYPRLSAVAENAWSPASLRDWTNFLPRIAAQLRRLHRAGIRAADSAFAVQIDAEPADANAGPNPGRAHVRLSNQAAFGELRYTTDGSEPHADSPRYTEPLALALPVTLTATAFFEGQPIAKPRRAVVDALALRTRSAEKLHPNPMMRAWRRRRAARCAGGHHHTDLGLETGAARRHPQPARRSSRCALQLRLYGRRDRRQPPHSRERSGLPATVPGQLRWRTRRPGARRPAAVHADQSGHPATPRRAQRPARPAPQIHRQRVHQQRPPNPLGPQARPTPHSRGSGKKPVAPTRSSIARKSRQRAVRKVTGSLCAALPADPEESGASPPAHCNRSPCI